MCGRGHGSHLCKFTGNRPEQRPPSGDLGTGRELPSAALVCTQHLSLFQGAGMTEATVSSHPQRSADPGGVELDASWIKDINFLCRKHAEWLILGEGTQKHDQGAEKRAAHPAGEPVVDSHIASPLMAGRGRLRLRHDDRLPVSGSPYLPLTWQVPLLPLHPIPRPVIRW